MRITYGVLSQGQGHVNRAAVLVSRLRARGHRVDVLLSGDTPPAYARGVLGDFEHFAVPNLVIEDGRVARRRTLLSFGRSLPTRIEHARQLARRLAQDRVDLVLTDFEPISAWAATLARIPSAGVSGQYRITRTNAPSPPGVRGGSVARAMMNAWTTPLDRYFAVSFAEDAPTRPRTTVVPPIVDDALRERSRAPGGFYLAYLYSYDLARVTAALGRHPARFRVYGMGGPGRAAENIELCATDRATFLDDLARCDGAILNGSFQGVCEAAALGKPVLSIPFQSQYEESFNAHQVERAGLGMQADALSHAAVAAFLGRTAGRTPRAQAGDGATVVLEELGL
jgi:uncharacterized protein (TIGR00661 family)